MTENFIKGIRKGLSDQNGYSLLSSQYVLSALHGMVFKCSHYPMKLGLLISPLYRGGNEVP